MSLDTSLAPRPERGKDGEGAGAGDGEDTGNGAASFVTDWTEDSERGASSTAVAAPPSVAPNWLSPAVPFNDADVEEEDES